MLNAGLGGVKVWVVWRGVPQPLAGADDKQDTERTVDAANTTCFWADEQLWTGASTEESGESMSDNDYA